jgi:hypothetical protein
VTSPTPCSLPWIEISVKNRPVFAKIRKIDGNWFYQFPKNRSVKFKNFKNLIFLKKMKTKKPSDKPEKSNDKLETVRLIVFHSKFEF